MAVKKLYVIGNSHMDPIWLWRLREGRSTWLNTCRSVIKMMKKYPMLKFARSSSVCYRWIEESDPALFNDIRKFVDDGRWEIVGGWVEQSDTIITQAESLIRQAEHAHKYFLDKFGRTTNIAYSVDAFGQNCGLPKILNATGFDRYVWMRPMKHEKEMPEAFRWVGDDGTSAVTSFRVQQAYCTLSAWKSREDLVARIESVMERGVEHQTLFFGIGDHGGGIYENQLKWLLELADKYDFEFSTLENYFNVIEKTELPVVTGEHTHHAPGCYSAVGEIKRNISRAEKALFKAEKIVLESTEPQSVKNAASEKLRDAWEELLFNYFHDVYPGTSIKDAFLNEINDICGYSIKTAVDIMEKQLCRYGASAKTDFLTEGGILVWNPLPVAVKGLVRFDTYSDPNATGKFFNILTDAAGCSIPLQWCAGASSFGPGTEGWGRATAVVELPPSGMKILAYGKTDAVPASLGFDRQRALLGRLEFPVLEDPNDTWAHGAQEIGTTLGSARLEKVEEMENGPVASRLRCHYSWKGSSFHMDIWAYKDISELEIIVSGWWQDVKQDLKLQLATGIASGKIISGQSGAVLERTPDKCEQPFMDWCAAAGGGRYAAFIVDDLHSYDSMAGTERLRLTLLRPVYYAEHEPYIGSKEQGMADVGSFEKRLWVAFGDAAALRAEMPARARERIWHAEHLEITAAADGSAFARDEWSIEPALVTVTGQYINRDGKTVFHLVNPVESDTKVSICKNGTEVWQGVLKPCGMSFVKL